VQIRAARWSAIGLAVLHAVFAVTATVDKSPTFDEPTHLTAGYSYWVKNDFRLDSENGNLPARWAALPLLLGHAKFVDSNSTSWQSVSAGLASRQFFYGEGNVPDELLLHGRVVMSLFGALLCFLVFVIAQHFFGTMGGLAAEALAAFDPNLLANSALVTSDVAAALFFTAAAWSIWRTFDRVSLRSIAFAALSVAGLFLSKMSAPIVIPILLILVLIRIMRPAPIEVRIGRYRRTFFTLPLRCVTVAATLTCAGAATIILIWAAFGFRFSALTENGRPRDVLNWRWNYLLSERTAISPAIEFARNYHLLPEAYLYGLLYTQQTSTSRPAFLDGECSDTGFVSFFPRTFLYKTPVPVLCFATLGALAAALRWKRRWATLANLTVPPSSCEFSKTVAAAVSPASPPSQATHPRLQSVIWHDLARLAPLWVLALVYGCFALAAHLDIGWRHLLPLYPALFVACGAAIHLWQRERVRQALPLLVILLIWQLGESIIVRPHYLAYFNEVAGGPARGYRHLVDSSLDWGQDLPSLGEWLRNNRGNSRHIYLAYFGSAEPTSYGLEAEKLPQQTNKAPLEPGLYCISATILQQVYEPYAGRWREAYEHAYQKATAWHNGVQKIALHPNEPDLTKQRDQAFHQLQFARLCAFLRQKEPVAQIGYSILVYNVEGSTLRQALLGPAPP
jgi:hypothetical protein